MVLILLIILLLFSPYVYRQILSSDPYTSAEDKRLLDSLVFLINTSFELSNANESSPIEYFSFDPNTASAEELISLGIPQFIANRVINYRSKGGEFLIKRDLLKIYDFPDSIYHKLSPYIRLQREKKNVVQTPEFVSNDHESEVDSVSSEVLVSIDINLADSTRFKELRGIGSSYARRIIAYRKLLGGYHSIDQLTEVYGMTDTLFKSIEPFLQLTDTALIRKIHINLATFKELLAHPYIDYEQTKEILNVKSKSGKFRRAEDMYRLSLMDSVMIRRLLPYLDFR